MPELSLLDPLKWGLSLLYWQGVKDGAMWAAVVCILLFLLFHREGGGK